MTSTCEDKVKIQFLLNEDEYLPLLSKQPLASYKQINNFPYPSPLLSCSQPTGTIAVPKSFYPSPNFSAQSSASDESLNRDAVIASSVISQAAATVASFEPPRQRRRCYEEIERHYKCNWKDCERAYGTLNHLNHHVTLQGHGPRRQPEEFRALRRHLKRQAEQRKEEQLKARIKQELLDEQARALLISPAMGHFRHFYGSIQPSYCRYVRPSNS
eukprot:Partr_v1_DN24032_c1_g1_i3_m34828 putative C2H2 transcription factor (Con7)